jgi:HK97 family phage prohead protease
MQIEYRKAELRAATNAFEVAGRAASYNTPSSDLGGFVEKLAPGCFSRSLAAGEDVKCLVNHDSNQVLGRLANKTLALTDAPDGLHFVCRLNKDSQAHRDLYASVKRGDLSECSFAFIVDGEDGQSFSAPDRNGLLTRTIKRAKLLDVSVVASPAYGNGATSVDARAAAAAFKPACAKPRLHSAGPNEEKCEECTRVTKRLTYHTKEVKKDSKKRAREVMAEYPELSAETIASRMRIYSGAQLEDVLLQLRFAEITKRQGVGFEPGIQSPRYQGGQSEDPTASLRTGYGTWNEEWYDRRKHENARDWLRFQAQRESDWQTGAAAHAAADLHDKASRLYPYDEALGRAACEATARTYPYTQTEPGK